MKWNCSFFEKMQLTGWWWTFDNLQDIDRYAKIGREGVIIIWYLTGGDKDSGKQRNGRIGGRGSRLGSPTLSRTLLSLSFSFFQYLSSFSSVVPYSLLHPFLSVSLSLSFFFPLSLSLYFCFCLPLSLVLFLSPSLSLSLSPLFITSFSISSLSLSLSALSPFLPPSLFSLSYTSYLKSEHLLFVENKPMAKWTLIVECFGVISGNTGKKIMAWRSNLFLHSVDLLFVNKRQKIQTLIVCQRQRENIHADTQGHTVNRYTNE